MSPTPKVVLGRPVERVLTVCEKSATEKVTSYFFGSGSNFVDLVHENSANTSARAGRTFFIDDNVVARCDSGGDLLWSY